MKAEKNKTCKGPGVHRTLCIQKTESMPGWLKLNELGLVGVGVKIIAVRLTGVRSHSFLWASLRDFNCILSTITNHKEC